VDVPEPEGEFNRFPFFVEPPSTVIELTKTKLPTSWSYQLPEVVDHEEEDVIEMRCELGATASFVSFDASERTLRIDDLSNSIVEEGNFTITFTLNDSKDTVSFPMNLTIFAEDDSRSEPVDDVQTGDIYTSTESSNSTDPETVASSFQSGESLSPEERLEAKKIQI